MKRNKTGFLMGIAVIAVIILVLVGYNIYRYPAMFRNLSDHSLPDSQVEELREEILSQPGVTVLVAYFSYSGTTRRAANAISEKTGGDLFEITLQDGYSNVYMESNREIRKNERPALTGTVENMDEYDVVFVGYPIWWHATPAPINTFLESYDLTGKLIIPFCTSGGSDIDETMPTFLNSCEDLAVYGERRISGTSSIDGWLAELGLENESSQILFQRTTTEEGAELLPDLEVEKVPVPEELIFEYETQELYAQRGDNRIYGVVYIPQGTEEKMPAVIFSHGFGGDYQVGVPYAKALAQRGYVVYCFDFCGGSPGSRSDGSMLEMSVLTEQADLEAVLRMIQEQPFVDKDNIFLMGTSMGGAVSAITAAAHEDEIQGAILLYPAFVMEDTIKDRFESAADIPDSFYHMWMTVGRIFAEDLLNYDIYEAASGYGKDVLLLHGDADGIVPLLYSEKAIQVYPSAQLYVLPGAGHGFYGSDEELAVSYILEYLNKHKNQ